VAVVNITNKHLLALYTEGKSKKYDLPPQVVKKYFMRIQQLEAAKTVADLLADTGMKFEAYKDHYSVRLNQQYRMELDVEWQDENQMVLRVVDIFEVSPHYGD
jgi:plasmid maintenance system killer protein